MTRSPLIAALFLLITCFAAAQVQAADTTVGFIYVGPKDDYGYSQSHAEGATMLKAMDGVTVLEEEKVAETLDVQKTMESMINLDGVSIIFATSYGYFDPHVVKVAAKYPKVRFYHCGGLFNPDEHPDNVGSYFGYIDEGQYLNGIAAGHATKSKKLGFIAAKPIPQVLRNINAFTMGARSVDPEITTTVIFTGDWLMPVKEAEAANSLIDRGIDVLACHVDSPKAVIQTAERRGIFSTGYHANQSALAPKGYLTGAEWNWASIYKAYIADAKADKKTHWLVRGGMEEGFVKMSPFGPAVSEEAKASITEIKAKMEAGGYIIFKGPLKDNTGKEVIPAGTSLSQRDPVLEAMDYLVEGVIGSTGG